MACAEYVDGLISPLRVEMENGKTVFLDTLGAVSPARSVWI